MQSQTILELKNKVSRLEDVVLNLQKQLQSLRDTLNNINSEQLTAGTEAIPQLDGHEQSLNNDLMDQIFNDASSNPPTRTKCTEFICKICSLAFHTKEDFQIHDQNAFCCDICLICFESKNAVRFHVQDFHPGFEPAEIYRKNIAT